MKFDYFYGSESEQFTFYRIPKILITSPVFKKVSDSAKLLYGLMLDRMGLSLKNGWVDERNRAFIYFTIKDVIEYMGCGTEKATKLMSELDDKKGIGLIERRNQGQGKPAIIYLKKFITDSDYEHNSRLSIIESQDFGISTNKTFENRKSRVSEAESTDFRQAKCNYNNINDNELNDNELNNNDLSDNHIISYHVSKGNKVLTSRDDNDMMRWIEERNIYEKFIKSNINYDLVVNIYGKVWLDEIIELMVDIVCSKKQYVRINKQNYPQEVVKNNFLKIDSRHIEYIYAALNNNSSDVRNIRAFLVTTIYRSIETVDNWYIAKVNYDMANIVRKD